jgi:hypothetical protein
MRAATPRHRRARPGDPMGRKRPLPAARGNGDTMIRSMTGFGVASAEVDGARYVIEVRSLNSKYF